MPDARVSRTSAVSSQLETRKTVAVLALHPAGTVEIENPKSHDDAIWDIAVQEGQVDVLPVHCSIFEANQILLGWWRGAESCLGEADPVRGAVRDASNLHDEPTVDLDGRRPLDEEDTGDPFAIKERVD